MSLNPGIVDANVLVYAVDLQAPQHKASRALLDAARTGSVRLYVSSQILCEFYSIITNARRVSNPRSSHEALNVVSDLMGYLQILPISVLAVEVLIDLLHRRPIVGGEIFDLQIVATMKSNAVSTIYTYNVTDFTVFQELDVLAP